LPFISPLKLTQPYFKVSLLTKFVIEMKLRSPIVATLGHVDHGKTTLLDRIRRTSVAKREAGGITQHVGASYITRSTIEEICGGLLKKFNVTLVVPGLLFIDTPGHEAFVTLRKRGGAVSDLAILVIDVTQGFQPQTDESLEILRSYKVPFLVAATKIDLIPGWKKRDTTSFLESFSGQRDECKKLLEERIYSLVGELSKRGFESERFDRVRDFAREIAIVPCSGLTGEGIAELLLVLAGLAQRFLSGRLGLHPIARGTILEVKEMRGFGKVIDVILYDGSLRKGDWIAIGGETSFITRIRALLLPRELQDLRMEKQFQQVDEVHAACGVRIACVELQNPIPGSPIVASPDREEIEKLARELESEVGELTFSRASDGVVIKADTLGSLEALLFMLERKKIPIKRTGIGEVTKQDLIEASLTKEAELRCILAFNVPISDELRQLAEKRGVKVIENNVIYRLLEEYDEFVRLTREARLKEKLEALTWPCKLRVLSGYVFRMSKPAIFGVEILAGKLKPGVKLVNRDGKEIGEVKEIQSEGINLKEAERGSKVAISVIGATVGRGFKEGDELFVLVPERDKSVWLRELRSLLSEEELGLLG